MRRIVSALLAGCLLVSLAATPAAAKKHQQAKNIDFGSISCQEFINDVAASDDDAIALVLMWLDGYLSGVSGDTRLNWNNLGLFTDHLLKKCTQEPGSKVLDVARNVGIN